MPGEFKVDLDTSPFSRAIRRYRSRELSKELAVGFRRVGTGFVNEMKRRQFSAKPQGPFRKNPSGRALVRRSGRLARSIGFRVVKSSAGASYLRVFVGNAYTPYALLQEKGGTVKGRPWLTVPLPDNLLASRARFESARRLRNDPAFQTWRRGDIIFVRRTDGTRIAGKAFIAAWVLKRKVTVPPRLGFERTWNRQSKVRRRILAESVQRAVDRIGEDTSRGG